MEGLSSGTHKHPTQCSREGCSPLPLQQRTAQTGAMGFPNAGCPVGLLARAGSAQITMQSDSPPAWLKEGIPWALWVHGVPGLYLAAAAVVVNDLSSDGVVHVVRSICGWQYEATQLYITMRAPFTVSCLQGWSFCEANEKGKNKCWRGAGWVGSAPSAFSWVPEMLTHLFIHSTHLY